MTTHTKESVLPPLSSEAEVARRAAVLTDQHIADSEEWIARQYALTKAGRAVATNEAGHSPCDPPDDSGAPKWS